MFLAAGTLQCVRLPFFGRIPGFKPAFPVGTKAVITPSAGFHGNVCLCFSGANAQERGGRAVLELPV